MNKKVTYIFLLIFCFFIGLNVVNAEETCSDVDKQIELYNYHKDQLDGVDCTDTSDENIVAVCNDSKMQKNAIVIELMRLNDAGKICKDNQSEVDKIVEENADSCTKIFGDTFTDFVNKVLTLFEIIGPILLIIFGSLDYANAVVSSDPELMKKANQKFLKRLTATIMLILAPVLTNIILAFNTSNYDLSGNSYSCEYTYSAYFKNWNIVYKPQQTTTTLTSNNNSNNNSSIGGTQEGGYTIFSQGDSAWGSKRLLESSSNTIASAGCALTSVAMEIVNSGVETTISVNPGTLNDVYLQHSDTHVGGGLTWSGPEYVTNNKFTLYSNTNMYGDINSKATELAGYISQGYYPVVQVKAGVSGDQHYVAVFSVKEGNIYVGDPATGTLSILNNTNYRIAKENRESQVVLYQKN